MRFIFCIIGVLLYSGLSAQQMSVLSTDSTYNIVRELQEVVVTAEKRELNPGDIPTALTVITPQFYSRREQSGFTEYFRNSS